MATNLALLAQLGRLIAESTADEFTTPVRQLYLNQAYIRAQSRITEVASEEFLGGATTHIIAGQQNYARPTNENIIRYEILRAGETPITGKYDELTYLPPSQAQRMDGESASYTDGHNRAIKRGWSRGLNGEILLWPTPTANVTSGLGVVYRAVLAMSADGDIPRMPSALHELLPYGAAIRMIEESKDAAEAVVDRWRARWDAVFGASREAKLELKTYYPQSQNIEMGGMNLGGQYR